MSDLRLAWTGSYEDLKKLVGEELKLNGTWQQPGGYKKVFTYSETSISWLKDKKTLTFEGKESKQLKQMLCYVLLGEDIVLNSNQAGVSVESVTDNSKDKMCSCLCLDHSDEIKNLHLGQLVHSVNRSLKLTKFCSSLKIQFIKPQSIKTLKIFPNQ